MVLELSGRGQIVKFQPIFIQPLLIGFGRGHLTLELLVTHNPALGYVHQEHPAWFQSTFVEDILRRHVQHAHLRGHNYQVILGHVVARRTQTITIEYGPNHSTVGKTNRGRAIPRLHKRAVVFVESLFLLAHALVVGPRLRDHHHNSMR